MSAVTPVGKAYKFKTLDDEDVFIGDVADSEFHPKIHLPRWNNECFFKFLYDDSKIAQKSVALEDGKVKWSTPLFDLYFYPLVPNEQAELGGLEFEVVLKAKPPTNVFSLPILVQNLTFLYQPPLTEEYNPTDCIVWTETHVLAKDNREFWRAENVVGSYAVYHATRTNVHKTRADAEKYKAGKAFHIYRPKLTDSDGKIAWADLNIDEINGILTITVPQDFLDSAKYPVTMDPTFGYTSIGATSDYTGANRLFGSWFTAPSDVYQAESITKYTREHNGQSGHHWKGLLVLRSDKTIIADGVTDPGELPTTIDWVTVTYSTKPTLAAGVDYAICAVGEYAMDDRYDSEAGKGLFDGTNSYASPTDPTDGSWYGYKISIYATYTTGGGVTYEIYADAIAKSLSTPAEECTFKIEKEAIARSDSLEASEATFNVSKDVMIKALSDCNLESLFNVLNDALAQVSAVVSVEQLREVFKDAIVQALAAQRVGSVFSVSKDAAVVVDVTKLVQSMFGLGLEAVVKVLAEVSVVKEGEVKVTRLFLVFGDLAVQIQGD